MNSSKLNTTMLSNGLLKEAEQIGIAQHLQKRRRCCKYILINNKSKLFIKIGYFLFVCFAIGVKTRTGLQCYLF